MKNRLFFSFAAASLLSMAACGGGSGASGASAGAARADDVSDAGAPAAPRGPVHRLTFPHPPAALSTDSARLNYVLEHFWDSFDRCDTTWIADTAALEQAFADWTGVLRYVSEPRAVQSIGEFFRSTEAAPPVRDRLLEVAEHYLHDPNSPMRNETWYIAVLRYAVASPTIADADKIRPRAQLKMACKNRPGMVAADFAYTTPDGHTKRLHDLRGERTLLLFYNPGCPECARAEKFIASSPVLGPLIAGGELKVLAVYADGDLEAWREHLPEMPEGWTVACDKQGRIVEASLYDLRAIPCIFLLDAGKRVILKDATVERVEAWLAAAQKTDRER